MVLIIPIPMFEKIKNKRVLITGASSGIGACTAELFASYGATVGIHYNTGDKDAEDLGKKISNRFSSPVMIKADLLNPDQRDRIVQTFIDETGGIDVLVNNAGAIIGTQHFLKMDTDSWNKTLNLNLTAPFFLARSAFSSMKDNGSGRIISISSIAAKYGGSASSIHYGAAKAGIEAVTRTLAREGAQYNILVNAIAPGVIETEFHKKIGRSSLEVRVTSIPVKRAGKPIDIARLCVFLASEGGDYITGQVYGVTGGD
ncbi:SDR family NAD(P)-dependent oxidoreductase [Methanoregula sp.]|uniref:SDR family NAD(P)-dependent oxidoreductase n=1 Tax=Methanoregula sp. TaxID=2052170 RepID=UPI003C737AE7